MTDLRDNIARAIHDSPSAQSQYVKAGIAPHGFESCPYSEQYFNDADAVLTVLDDVRAEAQVEALREAADQFQKLTGTDSPVFSPAIADYLHARADRIARVAGIVSEGTTTGENDG